MAAHIAFNDRVAAATTHSTSVSGTATRTIKAGEPHASIATRPLARYAGWDVTGGASGGSVLINSHGTGGTRAIRVIAALGVQVPAGCTSIVARVLNGSTTPTGTAPPTLAAVDFARPFDTTQPWNIVWTLDAGVTGNGARLEFVLGSGATGILRVGRLWASESLRLPNGVDAGWSREFDDTSVVSYGPQSRTPSVYAGPTFCRMTAALSVVDDAAAIGTLGAADLVLDNLQAVIQYLGRGRDCILIPRDSSALYRQQLPVYGLIDRAPVIPSDRVGPYFSTEVAIAETR
jgi:hypothetical protein